MESKVSQFLEQSVMAERVKPESRVVVHRTRLSPAELLGLKKRGSLGPVQKKEMVCELEVNGTVLAEGRIIRSGGEHYFKVTKIKS